MPIRTEYNMSQVLTSPRTHSNDKMVANKKQKMSQTLPKQPKRGNGNVKSTGGIKR